MRFQTPLVPARLVRRYKRFLADCQLDDGTTVTAHCPNPGSMTGLATPGAKIWLEPNADPRKKLDFGWRLVEFEDGGFACIDTSVANRVLHAALAERHVPSLADYGRVRPEVKFGKNSRVDFLLSNPGLPDMYLEVKSVTLSRQPGLAEFPDSVTIRGTKHLCELAQIKRDGHRAVMFYLVQRTDCQNFDLAHDIDPTYSAAFAEATRHGVEVMCYSAQISPDGVTLASAVSPVF